MSGILPNILRNYYSDPVNNHPQLIFGDMEHIANIFPIFTKLAYNSTTGLASK
jgi:hypothetical protein